MAATRENSNEREPAGEVRSQLQRSLVALLTEYHGRGPSRAKVFVDENVITCVFEEPFTWAERRLIGSGQEEHVHRGRALLREEQAARIRSLVEGATGRRLLAFMGQSHTNPDVLVWVLLLAPSKGETVLA
jgi:uncharacterized protein YbcI